MADFIIAIDSREQHPYTFECQTERKKLKFGDYSVVGLEEKISVERKSLKDFESTVIHEMSRFRAELDGLRNMFASIIIVEADMDYIMKGSADISCAPAALVGWSAYIHVNWGVPVLWCGSRVTAIKFVDKFLREATRKLFYERAIENN